jgi:hypothetical protein
LTEDFLMKRAFLITGLMAALALAVFAASAANFAGTWALDKTKSQGLSPRMAGADKVTWTITQDANTITIDSKVEGGQPAGGGGMGGGRGPAGPSSYKLDGSETSMDVPFGQMTGKATLKATWAGDALELSRKTTFTTPDGERTSTSTQKLSLSGDGKVLTAVVHSEGGRGGPQDSTLVFNKQ